jgi:hypothetical protein
MSLNTKGKKIKKAMEKQYGKKKGATVFYASENKGTIKGVKKKKKNKNVKRLTRTVPPKKGPDSQGIDIPTN